ncbi:MAG: glutaredoxin [Clostridia bacterium]|nr:glutaredoxin [Clostridia bacterium]
MKKVTVFYLENCPYCKKARAAFDALLAENPAYGALTIEWIEESRQSELAESFDYYYVPSLFAEGRKLYECFPSEDAESIRRHIQAALNAALES